MILQTRGLKYQSDDSWVSLVVDYGILQTYLWLVKKEFPDKRFCEPLAKAHVTFVRGKTLTKEQINYIRKQNPKDFVVDYLSDIQTDGFHWWLPAFSVSLDALRGEIGLAKKRFPYHITFGVRC